MFNPRAKLHKIGRFDVVRLIGFGGVGVVFEAIDPHLGRNVALKLCKDVGPVARSVLRREATLLARLSHPNVVTIHEWGRNRRGEDYYVMELVVGGSAHHYIRECERWQDAVAAYVGAGLGLAAAHDHGIIHGDFKPANVLIGDDGRVRVADFGLARALADHPPIHRGSVGEAAGLGTLAFMAPERLSGHSGDARSDQFSFCVALWQLLYATTPFVGDHDRAQRLWSIRAGDRQVGESLPRIPRRLRAILDRGLAHDPDRRHASMRSLVRELTRLLPVRRRQQPWLAAGLGLGLGVLVDRAWVERAAPPREQAQRTGDGDLLGVELGTTEPTDTTPDRESMLATLRRQSAWRSGL